MTKKRKALPDSDDAPTTRAPRGGSVIAWSLFAGLCFAVARFVGGSLALGMFGLDRDTSDPTHSGILSEARTIAWVATGAAGIVGAWIWRFLVAADPSPRFGAFAGLRAATFSYVGIVAYAAVVGAFREGTPQRRSSPRCCAASPAFCTRASWSFR